MRLSVWVCDVKLSPGCHGRTEAMKPLWNSRSRREKMPEGWSSDGAGDKCPVCLAVYHLDFAKREVIEAQEKLDKMIADANSDAID